MITRYPLQIKDVLYSEHLCCYPAENQAAKIYAKFLAEHPEFTSKDVDMYIEREEREEDHYGNGSPAVGYGPWEGNVLAQGVQRTLLPLVRSAH